MALARVRGRGRSRHACARGQLLARDDRRLELDVLRDGPLRGLLGRLLRRLHGDLLGDAERQLPLEYDRELPLVRALREVHDRLLRRVLRHFPDDDALGGGDGGGQGGLLEPVAGDLAAGRELHFGEARAHALELALEYLSNVCAWYVARCMARGPELELAL
jgi:hypothetical protein